MKRYGALAALAALTLTTHDAAAASRTVTLEVPGMNCAACPLIVRTALLRVGGVKAARVTYDPKEAVVTFEDTETSLGELTKATAAVGYPSAPKR